MRKFVAVLFSALALMGCMTDKSQVLSNSCETCMVRKIVLKFDDSSSGEETIIARSELPTYMRARIELNYKPGINPHNGGRTARIHSIEVYGLHEDGPYWWTVPGLQNNSDKNGAKVYRWRLIVDESCEFMPACRFV